MTLKSNGIKADDLTSPADRGMDCQNARKNLPERIAGLQTLTHRVQRPHLFPSIDPGRTISTIRRDGNLTLRLPVNKTTDLNAVQFSSLRFCLRH